MQKNPEKFARIDIVPFLSAARGSAAPQERESVVRFTSANGHRHLLLVVVGKAYIFVSIKGPGIPFTVWIHPEEDFETVCRAFYAR